MKLRYAAGKKWVGTAPLPRHLVFGSEPGPPSGRAEMGGANGRGGAGEMEEPVANRNKRFPGRFKTTCFGQDTFLQDLSLRAMKQTHSLSVRLY